MSLNLDLINQLDLGETNEDNMGDIFIEEAECFAESVDAAMKHNACPAHLENLFNFGIDYRQNELNQRLVGQDDHASFGILDGALDILEGAI